MTDEDPALSEPLAALFDRNNARPLESHTPESNPHTVAVASVVTACRRLPGWTRVRKRQVGRFLLADESGRPRKKPGGGFIPISVSVGGDPDVELLWTPPGANHPRVVMIEVKTGSGVLSPVQRQARDYLLAGGCIHIVVRDGADAFQQIMELPQR
jgi:hypothetical protein